MGMSASQARLLSITTRLTNNEFSAQTITNSKLRLAEKSQEASEEYMDALSTEKLLFGTYDDNGNYTTTDLTAASIYDYSPIKNQYAITKPNGKIMVSNTDAKNFENSNTLSEFLDCYGLVEESEANSTYQAELDEYYKKLEQYNVDKAKYDEDYAIYETKYAEWLESQNQTDLYALFSGVVGTSETVINDGAQGHYYRGLYEENYNCYLHVLNTLLYYDGLNLSTAECTASNGKTVTLSGKDGNMTDEMTEEQRKTWAVLSSALKEKYCDKDDDFNTVGVQNRLKAAREEGRDPTELEILRSDYLEIDNRDGTYSYELKTLEQKAIDMYYIIKDLYNDNTLNTRADDAVEMLMNFTDGDMKNLTEDPPDVPKLPTEPEKPEEPTYTMKLNDKPKSQWYTNLWYLMNGSQTANKVKTTNYDYDGTEETIFTVEDSLKTGSNYEIFDDNSLYKSSEWLQFALEHGMVSLQQASYYDPTEETGKVPTLTGDGFTWNSIIYTNATDITSTEDDVQIAIAEAKYKKTLNEIESKDNKYDLDLKNLDTEHSALQTEYDSIKDIISKNVDRSFKAFS